MGEQLKCKRTWCGVMEFSTQGEESGELQVQCHYVLGSDFQVNSGYIVRLGNLPSKKTTNSESLQEENVSTLWRLVQRKLRVLDKA